MGNYVTGGTAGSPTLLAVIVSTDPIRFEFTIDEASLLRIERLTHDREGNPVDYEFLYFRADSFQYRLRVDRSRDPTPRVSR